MSDQPLFQDVIRRRRSVRKFEPGRSVGREVLERIVDCGRWAPSGANVQPWDFIVVDDAAMRDAVTAVFLRQAQRLVDHAKGFPAVKKTYLANTVAIILVLGDPRWKACFPQATTPEFDAEYRANNEAIFLCSLGAAIQNIQLGVAAEGLTSAWLSGGGEDETNGELAALLGYPAWMRAYGTIPIGFPALDQNRRYRRPLAQALHWNRLPAAPVPPPRAGRLLRKHASPLRHVPRRGNRGGLAGPRRDAGRVEGRVCGPRRQSGRRTGGGGRLFQSADDRAGHQAPQDLIRCLPPPRAGGRCLT